jgi:nitrate reductase assembly molybdenum cofactor insertion protein NarJ
MPNFKELKEEIRKLKKAIKVLEDENASLWFMLDELEKSNIKNPAYQKQFTEVFDKLKKQQLMTHKKVEEA